MSGMRQYLLALALLVSSVASGQAVIVRSGRTTSLLDVVTNGVDAGAGASETGLMCMGSDGTKARVPLIDSSGHSTVNQGNSWSVQAWVDGGVQVYGQKTNNNAAPGGTNVGALMCLANAAAPSWTEGYEVLASVDLAGNLRTTGVKTSNAAVPGATNYGVLACVATAANASYTEGYQTAASCNLAGEARTISALNVSLKDYEFCVSSVFDGGAYVDAGLENYSVFLMSAGLKALENCNSNTTNSVVCTCDGTAPVIGRTGKILPARGSGEAAVPYCDVIDITTTACAKLSCLSKTAAQTSASDGGVGCLRVRLGF